MQTTKLHGIFFEPPIEKYYLGHQFNEVYREGVYAPFLKDKSGLTIIDIGANVGLTTYYFSRFAKVVHSIEPSMEHFDVLSHMVKYNNLTNVELHKQAIWIKNHEGKLYRNLDNKTMYSLHGAVQKGNLSAEDVEVVTLDKFFEDNKIEHCDFMKLDVEGSEYEILGGEGFKKVAPKIDAILLEYHAWADRNPGQLAQCLKNNGFNVSTPSAEATLMAGIKK